MGTLTENSVGQWSIVGGTGEFTLAQGIINYKMDPASNKDDAIRELNIRIVYDKDALQVVIITVYSLVYLNSCHLFSTKPVRTLTDMGAYSDSETST
jgi:hypothetical protein